MSDHENQNDNGTAEAPPKDSTQINIQVKDRSGNSEVHFKIKKTTRFEKVMKAFCERNGKDMSTTRFHFDGVRIEKDATPADMEMEDGDLIDAFEEQIGGS